MKKNTLINLLAVAILSIFVGCTENSPLSDVDVTDPNLLAPEIILRRVIDSDGQLSHKVEIWIMDKNRNSVELKKGIVSLNGSKLKTDYYLLTNAPYYSSGSKVELNTPYKIDVELSDGKVYSSSITTQSNPFDRFVVPATYTPGADLPVSWLPITSPEETVSLDIICHGKNGKGEETTSSHAIAISAEAAQAGSYTISKDVLNECEKMVKMELSLNCVKKGVTNDKFAKGSEIVSTFTISKNVKAN